MDTTTETHAQDQAPVAFSDNTAGEAPSEETAEAAPEETPAEEETEQQPETDATPAARRIADVVREIIASSDLTEPRAIAKEVINRVEEFDDEQLVEILTPFVVSVVNGGRHLSVVPGSGTPGDQEYENREEKKPLRRPPQPSSRVAAINNWWEARLEERFVGANGVKKKLAEMTMDDVIANRDRVKGLIKRLETREQAWEELAATMVKHGKSKVGDLSVEQVPQAVAAIAAQ